MNISQIPLNPKPHTLLLEQNKDGGYGMLDLAIQVLACLGLFALPFIFMGYVRSRVRHALRAAGKVN
jgi:hypothetical protein